MKPVAWAALGTGSGVAVAGTITGALALAKSNDLEESCPTKEHCTSSDRDLKKSTDNLALATVQAAYADPGTVLQIEVTVEFERRRVPAVVMKTPFFDPPRRKA